MAFRRVAEFKEIDLQYQSNGSSTLQFFTDFPGGTLAPRLGAGKTLPDTASTRKTTTIPLDGIEGSEWYPQAIPGSTTQLRLYSGTIWYRPIGVYLDGSLGEIWQTVPLSVGS